MPFGFAGKIILARRACGIFPGSPACTEHDLFKPAVMGTPAPKSRTNKKNNVMMLQKAKKKYTLETLKPLNVLYDHEHWLTQRDVDMANFYVELIEATRSDTTPQAGDRLIYTDRHGSYYGNALIEKSLDGGFVSVCEEPYIPFLWKESGSIRLNVSGGAFHHVDSMKMEFVRWTEGAFKDWGHCGACANGTVAFKARVPLWSYSEPGPLYGDFTTETWRRYYLTKDTSPDARNLYRGFDKAFRTEEDFQQFLKDYEGTVFKGNWENQIVLWCFRHENRFLTRREWDRIDAPAVERRLNFHPEQVKLVKDMDSHITYCYRLKPGSNNL